MLSMNDDIRSVGPSQPEIIGRPTGFFLWIFVSRIKHWYARLIRCPRKRSLGHIVHMTSKMYVVDYVLQSLTTSVKLLES